MSGSSTTCDREQPDVFKDKNGRPMILGTRWPTEAVRLLYVDPRTGILRLNKKRHRR
jgi:hypothetical protein